jgi:hypothetical protein
MMLRTSGEEWWEAPSRVALLLITGIVLGPQVLDLLPRATVDLLAPLTPVALSALGIFAVVHRSRRAMAEVLVILIPAALLVAVTPALHDAAPTATRAIRALQTCGAAALIAGSGVMLLGEATAIARRVYLLAMILLLGGIADFVSAPALIAGFAGGCILSFLAPAVAQSITPDLQYVTRPLVTALLLLVGARFDVSEVTLMLAAAWLVAVVVLRRGTGSSLIGPGVYAVAAAVDVAQGLHGSLVPLVSAATTAVVVVQAALFFTATDAAIPLAAKGDA